MKNEKDGKFYYMIYSVPRSSEKFTPYSLKSVLITYKLYNIIFFFPARFVNYSNINKCDFLTISNRGVLQTYGSETVFTSLKKWEYEYQMYCKLTGHKTFSHFRIWKTFYMWRKYLSRIKISAAQKGLSENLFLLNPILRDALLTVQTMCYKFYQSTFTNFTKIDNYHFFYFIEEQVYG